MSRTALESRRAFAEGTVTATELVETCLNTIERHDAKLNVFLTVADEQARRQAADLDRRRDAKEPLGPLAGVCVAVKDLISTRDIRTTCGSRILEKYTPVFDATVIDRLKQADAIVVGKTNLDEFGMGSSNENSAYGPTRNPWDLDRVPGGSSGGSASSVSARQVPWSLGSDTGGSIRQPAALCGIVGMKPTYGAVSRYGLIAFASSLDQVGPFARTVRDSALLLQHMVGHDPMDSTSIDLPEPIALPSRERLDGLRVGVIEELMGEGVDAGVRATVETALAAMESLGATLHPVHIPHAKYALATYYLIAPAECSANLARFDGIRYGHRTADAHDLLETYERTRSEGFGPEVKRRIMLGTFALASGYYDAYYGQAQRVRTLMVRDFDDIFSEVDVVASPTSPSVAFPLGERTADPYTMYLSDICTIPMSLAGLPAMSIPCGLSDGLPVGLQLAGPALSENRLFEAAHATELALGFDTRPGGTA